MGEDISTGAKIGVVLVLLCAIIAIVFAIMSIMKNITNQGTEELQNSLVSMSLQKFDDYDQRQVTGAQVITACKQFQDQPYAIAIYTNRNEGTPVIIGLKDCKVFASVNGTETEIDLSAKPTGGIASLVGDNGYAIGKLPAAYAYNNNRSSLNDRADPAYVSNASKFEAYLIKTTSGEIMGMVFDEVGD